jgi:hypothetical protein
VNRVHLTLIASTAIALAGCPETTPRPDPVPDAGPDAPGAVAEWKVVLEGLDGALLSIWGTSADDIWTVGGSLGNGKGATVLRFDGAAWHDQHADATGGDVSYWWVNGSSATDVWLVGEKGRTTHWDGSKLEERASGTTATLFGVIAFAPDDAWAVGGIPEQPDQPNDVVLHWDGAAWTPEALPAPTKSALFKVWGTSKDDLYAVGEAGVIWHRTGAGWAREAEGLATGRLTTAYGCSASEIFVVGGRDLLTKTDGTWARAAIDPLLVVNDLNGVSCAPASAPPRDWGRVVVVGGGSLKLRLAGGTWQSDFGSKPFADLHGSWVDPTGAMWGVGGNFNATPKAGASRSGVVARYAADSVPGTLAN